MTFPWLRNLLCIHTDTPTHQHTTHTLTTLWWAPTYCVACHIVFQFTYFLRVFPFNFYSEQSPCVHSKQVALPLVFYSSSFSSYLPRSWSILNAANTEVICVNAMFARNSNKTNLFSTNLCMLPYSCMENEPVDVFEKLTILYANAQWAVLLHKLEWKYCLVGKTIKLIFVY